MQSIMGKLLLAALLTLALSAYPATIAVIDTGVDITHEALAGQIWANPKEIPANGRDDDGNNLVDDVHGHNFAKRNGQLFDYSKLDLFSEWHYRYFEVEFEILQNRAKREDVWWFSEIKDDWKLYQETIFFGGFIHGTHTAGIVAHGARQNQILTITLQPDYPVPERGQLFYPLPTGMVHQESSEQHQANMFLVRKELDENVNSYIKKLEEIFLYLNTLYVDVANMSLDLQARYIRGIVIKLFMSTFHRIPLKRELEELTNYFFEKMIAHSHRVLALAPNTLFIFPAGNESLDNDHRLSFPGSINTPNSMIVAASLRRSFLASFSNYGKGTTHLAAPGVGIMSAVPGNRYLPLTGTSQAAPAVSNVAGQIRDINVGLSPVQVKRVLMATVDRKFPLMNKVISGGVLNGTRAKEAAKFSLFMPVEEACGLAREVILDQ